MQKIESLFVKINGTYTLEFSKGMKFTTYIVFYFTFYGVHKERRNTQIFRNSDFIRLSEVITTFKLSGCASFYAIINFVLLLYCINYNIEC